MTEPGYNPFKNLLSKLRTMHIHELCRQVKDFLSYFGYLKTTTAEVMFFRQKTRTVFF